MAYNTFPKIMEIYSGMGNRLSNLYSDLFHFHKSQFQFIHRMILVTATSNTTLVKHSENFTIWVCRSIFVFLFLLFWKTQFTFHQQHVWVSEIRQYCAWLSNLKRKWILIFLLPSISNRKADIALIGLAVMGQNLILNMDSHGFVVCAYNRTVDKVCHWGKQFLLIYADHSTWVIFEWFSFN